MKVMQLKCTHTHTHNLSFTILSLERAEVHAARLEPVVQLLCIVRRVSLSVGGHAEDGERVLHLGAEV